MTNQDYVTLAKDILNKIIYVTLATVSEDGQPWNSPLYSAFDNNLNFYWTSDKEGIHSQNIRKNNKVFLVIYDSTMEEGTGVGVYVQGKAYELNQKEEINIARNTTQSRKNKTINEDEYIRFMGNNIRRVYKVIPDKIWVNDVELDDKGNYIKDIRVEINIDELKIRIQK